MWDNQETGLTFSRDVCRPSKSAWYRNDAWLAVKQLIPKNVLKWQSWWWPVVRKWIELCPELIPEGYLSQPQGWWFELICNSILDSLWQFDLFNISHRKYLLNKSFCVRAFDMSSDWPLWLQSPISPLHLTHSLSDQRAATNPGPGEQCVGTLLKGTSE